MASTHEILWTIFILAFTFFPPPFLPFSPPFCDSVANVSNPHISLFNFIVFLYRGLSLDCRPMRRIIFLRNGAAKIRFLSLFIIWLPRIIWVKSLEILPFVWRFIGLPVYPRLWNLITKRRKNSSWLLIGRKELYPRKVELRAKRGEKKYFFEYLSRAICALFSKTLDTTKFICNFPIKLTKQLRIKLQHKHSSSDV